MPPLPHLMDPRPFLNPVLRHESSLAMPAGNVFLPVIPSSPLEPILPKALRPTSPAPPSLALDGSVPHCRTPQTAELDITDLRVEAMDEEDSADDLFAELRGSRRDAEMLFPELEANKFQLRHPLR